MSSEALPETETGADEKTDENDVSRALDSIGQTLRTAGHTASDIQEILAAIGRAPGAQARLGKFGARLKMASDVAEMGEAIARNDGDKVLQLSAQLGLDFARTKGLAGAVVGNLGEALLKFANSDDKSAGNFLDILFDQAGDTLGQIGLGINIPGIGPLTLQSVIDVKSSVRGLRTLANGIFSGDTDEMLEGLRQAVLTKDFESAIGARPGQENLVQRFAQTILNLPQTFQTLASQWAQTWQRGGPIASLFTEEDRSDPIESLFAAIPGYQDVGNAAPPALNMKALQSNLGLILMRPEVMGDIAGYNRALLTQSIASDLDQMARQYAENARMGADEPDDAFVSREVQAFNERIASLKTGLSEFIGKLDQGEVSADYFSQNPIMAYLLAGQGPGVTRNRLAEFRQQMRNFSMQRAQQEETDLNTAASQALQQIGQKTEQQTVQDLIGLTREEKIADPASAPTVVEDEEKEDAPLGPVLEDAVELGPERARAKRYLPLTFAERRKRGRFTQLVQQEEPYRTPIQRFLM